jgi:hypothetical protein
MMIVDPTYDIELLLYRPRKGWGYCSDFSTIGGSSLVGCLGTMRSSLAGGLDQALLTM